MKPIKFEGVNRYFGKPKGWNEATDGKCNVLPLCVDEAKNHISVWKPTDEERAAIADGQNIVLNCVSIQPPVLLMVAPIDGPDAWPDEPQVVEPKIEITPTLTREIFTLTRELLAASRPDFKRRQ